MNAASLDWRTLPMAGDGRGLIEASAGTGKTWTIAALYQRLLLEQRLLPPQVVVTTFTNPAARELRDRLRARLVAAASLADLHSRSALPDGGDDRGDDDQWLVERWTGDPSLLAGDRIHLRLALAELDLAPVTTLHGLCGLLLSEHALETGTGFTAGTMTSGKALDAELRDDRWRRLAQSHADDLDAGDRAWAEAGRAAFDKALARVCEPGVGVRAIPLDATECDAVMHRDRARAIRAWLPQAAFKTVKSTMRRGLESLASFIEAGDPHATWPTGMRADLDKPLESQFKEAFVATARAHPVIANARHALEVLALAQVQVRAEALARHREALLRDRELRQRERGQVSYETLIARALAALEGPNGNDLAERLRGTWNVALVDEFQDTDARQYAILDRIWRDRDRSPRGRVVVIGDPKQAIYGFRGGDIDAYLKARGDARDVMRLAINRRSSAGYVAACNELFGCAGEALSADPDAPIRYEEAFPKPSARDDRALTCDGGPCARPLAFHVLPPMAPGEADDAARAQPKAAELREQALEACANHIATLLQERRHRIGDERLVPGDLAVLLPTNEDIVRLREHLAARGVPCVGAGTRAVFATDIARTLQVLLHGIAHAHEPAAVRAALATRFFHDRDFDLLRTLSDDSAAWQREQQRFTDWHRQWQGEGVQAVIGAVIAASSDRFAGRTDMERALTDLRHLGELLQARAARGDGPAALLAWFADQREGGGAADEDAEDEQQLRIESDARRVRLMTLHKSKGLQFPVVFLPLSWFATGRDEKLPLVRDATTGERLLDLGGPGLPEAQRAAEHAAQEERFRVLYVALTRAQHACHVYALGHDATPDPKRSALSALLARLHDRLDGRPVEDACPHVAWSWGWEWPARRYEPERKATERDRRAERMPAPRPLEGRHSFTTLAQRRDPASGDDAASDESTAESGVVASTADEGESHPELVALAAWRGTAFGNALHAIFEQRDIAMPMRAQHALVLRCLHEAGFAGADAEAMVRRLAARVQAVLDTPLPLDDGRTLRLADLSLHAMHAEMGFHYALDGASLQRLREACARHGEPDLVPPHASSVLRGLMSGAIDLVFEHAGRFHVLDWKSNFLGEGLADYAPSALRVAMDSHHYRFQALLYAVALDRYLRSRLRGYRREAQLGAAVYLFVRAIGLAPDAGIWTQRFDDGLLAAVDAVLAGRADTEAA